ncbi:MAG: hypothetical protein QMC09_09665, partial [Thauera sp.]
FGVSLSRIFLPGSPLPLETTKSSAWHYVVSIHVAWLTNDSTWLAPAAATIIFYIPVRKAWHSCANA